MEGAVALVLALLAIPFVLPVISWVMARNVRRRVDELEQRVAYQDESITRLTNQIAQLKKEGVAAQPAPAQPVAAAPAPPKAPPVVAPPTAPARPPITVTPPAMETPTPPVVTIEPPITSA